MAKRRSAFTTTKQAVIPTPAKRAGRGVAGSLMGDVSYRRRSADRPEGLGYEQAELSRRAGAQRNLANPVADERAFGQRGAQMGGGGGRFYDPAGDAARKAAGINRALTPSEQAIRRAQMAAAGTQPAARQEAWRMGGTISAGDVPAGSTATRQAQPRMAGDDEFKRYGLAGVNQAASGQEARRLGGPGTGMMSPTASDEMYRRGAQYGVTRASGGGFYDPEGDRARSAAGINRALTPAEQAIRQRQLSAGTGTYTDREMAQQQASLAARQQASFNAGGRESLGGQLTGQQFTDAEGDEARRNVGINRALTPAEEKIRQQQIAALRRQRGY